jgi:RNA polymerase sigma-70 factor (ECF subfamily)
MTPRKPFFRPRLVSDRTPVAGGGDRGPDQQAARFRALILPHMDGAYNFARYLTRDATAAEDIVQEAFLRAFRAFPTWRGDAPKAWLFAIVRNCFLTWTAQRSGQARTVVDEGALSETQALALANVADDAQDTPEAALLRRREIETVRAVIENLPEPFRETLVLRELEELSYKEIAVLTAAPIGTVMSRLARARQMLGEMLMPDGAPTLREVSR